MFVGVQPTASAPASVDATVTAEIGSSAAATFPASPSLAVPGAVTAAELTLTGVVDPDADSSRHELAIVDAPSGGQYAFPASSYLETAAGDGTTHFTAHLDVTPLVQDEGSGTWSVLQVAPNIVWQLIVTSDAAGAGPSIELTGPLPLGPGAAHRAALPELGTPTARVFGADAAASATELSLTATAAGIVVDRVLVDY